MLSVAPSQQDNLQLLVHRSLAQERVALSPSGIARILDGGRAYDLSPVLENGGALLFPHTYLERCGYQVAACVHALLDSGADQALLLGLLHGVEGELARARERVERGGDRFLEVTYGVQGPGAPARNDWMGEFSLLNFCYLLQEEGKRRGVSLPRLAIRYPYLVGPRPDELPGIEELEARAKDSVVLATGDLFHHGQGYGIPPEAAREPDIKLARGAIEIALEPLVRGDYPEFLRLSKEARSDWPDVGPVLRHLLGPLVYKIRDVTWADTSNYYEAPPPNWVAASLISFDRARSE